MTAEGESGKAPVEIAMSGPVARVMHDLLPGFDPTIMLVSASWVSALKGARAASPARARSAFDEVIAPLEAGRDVRLMAPGGREVLDVEIEEGGSTIREFLAECMKTLVRDGDAFNSKRPLGNSDWWWDLAYALRRERLIPDPKKDNAAMRLTDELLCEAIDAMAGGAQ